MSDSKKLQEMFNCYFENKEAKDLECKEKEKELENYEGDNFEEELSALYKKCDDTILNAKRTRKRYEKNKEEKLAKEKQELEEAERRREEARIAREKAEAAVKAEKDELKRKELERIEAEATAKEEEEKAKVKKKEKEQKWKEDEPELKRHSFEDKKKILRELLLAKLKAAEKGDLIKLKRNYQFAIQELDNEEDIDYPVSNDENFSIWLKNKFLNLSNWNYFKRIEIYNEYINKLKEKPKEEEIESLEEIKKLKEEILDNILEGKYDVINDEAPPNTKFAWLQKYINNTWPNPMSDNIVQQAKLTLEDLQIWQKDFNSLMEKRREFIGKIVILKKKEDGDELIRRVYETTKKKSHTKYIDILTLTNIKKQISYEIFINDHEFDKKIIRVATDKEKKDFEEKEEEERKKKEDEHQKYLEKLELELTVDNNCGCQVKPTLDEASNYNKHEKICKELNKTSECSRQPNCIPLIGKLIFYYKEIDTYHSKTTTYNKQINFLKKNMSKIVNKIDEQQPWETKILKEIKKFVEAIELWETETYITRVHDEKEIHYKVINRNCPQVERKDAEKEECFVEYISFRPSDEQLVKTGTKKYNLSRLKGEIKQGVEYKKADNNIEKKIEELLLKKSEKEPVVIAEKEILETATEVDNTQLKKLQAELEETKEKLEKQIAESKEHEESELKKLQEQQQQELQKKLDEQSEEFKKELEEAVELAERDKDELVAQKKRFKVKLKKKIKKSKESEKKIEELNQKIKNLSKGDAEEKAKLEAEKERIKNLLEEEKSEQKKLEEKQAVVERKTNELHKEQMKIELLKSQHEKELEELRNLEKKQKEREEEKRKQVKEKFMELKGKLIESELKKLKETDSIGDIKIEGIKKSYPKLHDKIKRFLIFKEDELIKAHHAKFYSDNIKRNNEKLLETLKLIPGEPFLGIKGLPLMAAFGSEVKKENPKEEVKKVEKPKEEEIESLKEIKKGVREFIIDRAKYIFYPSKHHHLSVKEYLKTL